MDKKTSIAIVVIIVIIVIAAAAAVAINNDDKDDDKNFVMNEGYVFSVDTVAKVYGNANNDDKIDSSDVSFIQDIIDGKTTWDSEKNPYADAYKDGTIDSKDVDQVKMIMANTSGTVWYENYYGEAQSISFPLTGKKIGVTYWQQAQLVDLLGHWSDVVAANASVTTARSNQYDLSNVTYAYGTTGSSKLTEEFCEGYAAAGVDLIIGSPYKSTVTEVANTYLPDVPVVTLGIGGASCVSSALTLGILMNENEKAQNYEKYVVDTINTIKEKLSSINDKDKPNMLIVRMYADNNSYIDKYGGILVNCANTDGSYQLLSMMANLYTDNSETSTTPNRTQEWILSQNFDLIFDMEVYTGFQASSIEGQTFYTQSEYNDRFENSVQYFKGTKAYNNGGVLSSSYIFDGYSGFSSLMMAAYMIYPDQFTLAEGQASLQKWYDDFTNVDLDVTVDGGYYYTGDKYTCQFKTWAADLSGLLNTEVSPTLNVCGNVNGDLVIDENDISALRSMIEAGTTDSLKVNDSINLGDANHDGKVDSDDLTYIQSIIDATVSNPVTVTHLNRYGDGDYWTESKYPIASFASAGSANMLLMYMHLGIKDQIKAISYYSKPDETLFADYLYLFSDSSTKWNSTDTTLHYRVGGSATYFSKELLTKHITDDNITAVIVADNHSYLQGYSGKSAAYQYAITEADAEALGLDVIRVAPSETDQSEYLSDYALLAFFMKVDDSIVSNIASWISSALTDMNNTIKAHVGVDTNQISAVASSSSSYSSSGDSETSKSYVSSGNSDYTAVLLAAGAKFVIPDSVFGNSTTHSENNEFGAWLSDYSIDKIVCIRTGTGFSWYGGTTLSDGTTVLSNYMKAFKYTEPYYENEVYAICGDMPVIIRVLYAATVLYPDLFSEEWADKYNTDYSTTFLGLSSETMEKGDFSVSMTELGLNGKA